MRFPWNNVLAYIAVQVLGAIVAHSPGGYSLESAILAEGVLTFMFLMIILGATDKRAPAGFAPIAIVDSGRMGPAAALALLGCADHRRGHRRSVLSQTKAARA